LRLSTMFSACMWRCSSIWCTSSSNWQP
jgi:hypothetical protein